MYSIILYWSYLSFPFLALVLFLIFKKRKQFSQNILHTTILFFFLFLSLLFIYSRFIERNLILTKTTKIETGFSAKIVVISDIHLGPYKNHKFLERIVNKINKIEDADAVLIAGDLTYYPEEDLETLFSPLKDINIPVYAVLWNHDTENPGPPIQKELQRALKNNNIVFLKNTSAEIDGRNISILGLRDKWTNDDDISLIEKYKKEDNLIVLTHNPDTTLKYTNSIADITVSGHAHGWQIRLPFIYHSVIPCEGEFDQWLYETDYGKVFVSAGVGEVWLPMRLGVPPTIEILELY